MLREVTVPPGEAGLDAVWAALRGILAGEAPPTAIVPPADGTPHTQRIRAAMAFDAGDDDLEGIAAVVATSGSTGHPRGVLFTANALTALKDGPDYTWIVALPLTSIGGLGVALRASLHDRRPIALSSIGGAGPFSPTELATVIERIKAPAPAITLVPTQLARCLADPQCTAALRACARILIGGARLPRSLKQACEAAGVDVISTYGATETAGGCVWDGIPLPGVDIAIESDGRIYLAGPMLASGYRADPEASARAFTSRGFRTDDRGHLDPNGSLDVEGRLDNVVTINGVNVALDAVEEVIAGVPGIRACAVTVRAPESAAPELLAWVVGSDAAAEQMHDAVVRALGRPAAPRAYRILEALPLLPNGKVDRQALGHDGNHS